MTGPKRKPVPLGPKLEAALAQLGDLMRKLGMVPVEVPIEWECDHDPALGIRPINAAGTDWEPPQHDPRCLIWRPKAGHRAKTYGTNPATSVGSDRHAIDHTRRLSAAQAEMRSRMLEKEPGRPPEKRGTIPCRKGPKVARTLKRTASERARMNAGDRS